MKFCFDTKTFIEPSINPSKLAVIDANRALTWLQFETEVNAMVTFMHTHNYHHLANPVLLYGHKQADMIVVMYAMMKLNIAYIPVDVIYPTERIATIQRIANAQVVFNCTTKPLQFANTTEINVLQGNISISQNTTQITLRQQLPTDPLVYIIFTSGSTGEPKGVQITTKAIQTFAYWMSTDFGFTANDVFINIAVFSFDLSVYEIMSFGALGATLLLNDKTITENSELLMERIHTYQGTVWVSTPSFAFAYSRIGADVRLNSLTYFLFCGETLPHPLASSLHKSFTNAIIYNTYGPTEATVATTQIAITQAILDAYNPLPVGYAKRNCELLIAKENADDKAGELIIVGDHVSIGYFKNEELNAQKFYTHEGKRAFKTGDLAYYQNDMLFCMGRNDDQVKMNGFRIELNEISNVILKHETIADAVTVGLKRNNEVKKIVSFVITKNTMNKAEVNQTLLPFLQKALPYYMLPGDVEVVTVFPYNNNYKIDKPKLIAEYLQRQLQ
jgi:D-alanine--poly(phosphoribitol) ligase subunit 1